MLNVSALVDRGFSVLVGPSGASAFRGPPIDSVIRAGLRLIRESGLFWLPIRRSGIAVVAVHLVLLGELGRAAPAAGRIEELLG